MKGSIPRLSWLLFFFWSTWLFAVTGWLASGPLGAFAPDLGLVLLMSLERKHPGHRAFVAATLVAAARIALSTDAPLAILAGYLGVAGGVGLLRRAVELDRSVSRGILTALLALALSFWWRSARWVVLASDGIELQTPAPEWRGAVATGLVTLIGARLFLRLPGLSPFARGERRHA